MRITTAADAERLLELARRKSQAGRESLYKNIWDLFENRGNSLSERERILMRDILRRLSRDVEMSVRTRLAERLAQQKDAPHDLSVMLANECIEVAYPILMESRVLQDLDLIEVVRHRTLQHQLTVAMRQGIGNEVAQALADTGQQDVITALLNNHTARLSDTLIEHLVAESRRVDNFQNPLLRRPDLPKHLAMRMYVWVSAALRQHIAEHYKIDIDELDDTVAATLDEIAESEDIDTDAPSQRLVNKLYDAGELTPAFLVKALRQSEITLFELGFAKLTTIRPLLMRRIIYEPGGEALAMACRAIGVDRQVFLTIYQLTRHASDTAPPTPAQLAELKTFFDGLSRETAGVVLRKWLRNPQYLAALKQLGVNR